MRRLSGSRPLPREGRFTAAVRHSMAAATILFGIGAVPSSLPARDLVPVAEGGSASDQRQEAQRAVPWQRIDPQRRAAIRDVLDNATIYRRMPTYSFACAPDLYLFLVNRPDTVVNIWNVLGVSDVKLAHHQGNSYLADDMQGTTALVEFLHRSRDVHVIYADGAYQGALLPRKVKGRSVMILRTNYRVQPDGTKLVIHTVDSFIKIDNFGADLIARTLQSTAVQMADRNFGEISAFVRNLAGRIEGDHDWGVELVNRLHKIRPETRDQFADVIDRLHGLDQVPPPARGEDPRLAARGEDPRLAARGEDPRLAARGQDPRAVDPRNAAVGAEVRPLPPFDPRTATAAGATPPPVRAESPRLAYGTTVADDRLDGAGAGLVGGPIRPRANLRDRANDPPVERELARPEPTAVRPDAQPQTRQAVAAPTAAPGPLLLDPTSPLAAGETRPDPIEPAESPEIDEEIRETTFVGETGAIASNVRFEGGIEFRPGKPEPTPAVSAPRSAGATDGWRAARPRTADNSK